MQEDSKIPSVEGEIHFENGKAFELDGQLLDCLAYSIPTKGDCSGLIHFLRSLGEPNLNRHLDRRRKKLKIQDWLTMFAKPADQQNAAEIFNWLQNLERKPPILALSGKNLQTCVRMKHE